MQLSQISAGQVRALALCTLLLSACLACATGGAETPVSRQLPTKAVPEGDTPQTMLETAAPTVTPSLTPALEAVQPTPTTASGQTSSLVSSNAYLALPSPDGEMTLFLFGTDHLRDAPQAGAIGNLGYALLVDDSAFVIVAVNGQEQTAINSDEAPSIFAPASARPGDRLVLFAATPYGRTTAAAQFTLGWSDAGWHALDLNPADTPPPRQVALATPTPRVWDPSATTSLAKQPVALRVEALHVTPDAPRQGQPFTVTAVIRNLGDADARAPVWLTAHGDRDAYPAWRSLVFLLFVPSQGEAEMRWQAQDKGTDGRSLLELGREHPSLTVRAGVNVHAVVGWGFPLQPEADKLDNSAEMVIDLAPYELQVSDACPPSDNLWVDPGQEQAVHSSAGLPSLNVIVRNQRQSEVARVPVRTVDAAGQHQITYAHWVPPCDGGVKVDVLAGLPNPTFPITVTLNPADGPFALPESDRSDNRLVLHEGQPCSGPTDLWLAREDVRVDGDDLLVTVHLRGSPPRSSFSLHVFHTLDGQTLATQQVTMNACMESTTIRLENALQGRRGGFLLIEIDTEGSRVESVYPQHNNSAVVPLP